MISDVLSLLVFYVCYNMCSEFIFLSHLLVECKSVQLILIHTSLVVKDALF